jgi:hypothetical protein
VISPKLTAGVALLWHEGVWVDAITDEVARETGRFTHWQDGYPAKPILVVGDRALKAKKLGVRSVDWSRLANYEDTRGRKWMQRSFWRRGIMVPMIVKVEMQRDSKADVVMISNQDGSLRMTVSPTAPLLARMQGQTKRYFDAEVVPSAIELGELKPDQGW